MFRKKEFGNYTVYSCPFCSKTATIKNPQGVPVCVKHKEETLNELKCVCGETLEILEGKWGPYFRCFRCGNLSFNKGISMNQIMPKTQKKVFSDKPKVVEKKKEVTIRSDELDFI